MKLPPHTLLVSDDRETVMCLERGGFSVLTWSARRRRWVELFHSNRLHRAEDAYEVATSLEA